MKYDLFDVIELKDKNRGTILKVEKDRYYIEIVNSFGITLGTEYVTDDDINSLVFKSK